jgi:hypothetical protein
MGQYCTTCSGDKENEAVIENSVYVPDSIRPRAFPMLSEYTESDHDSPPYLTLPYESGSISFVSSPSNKFSDKWDLPTNDISPESKLNTNNLLTP